MSLTNEEKKEFNILGKRMLELYHKADQNHSVRKIIIGYDDKGHGDYIMFFQGNHEDAAQTYQFLKKRNKETPCP